MLVISGTDSVVSSTRGEEFTSTRTDIVERVLELKGGN